MEGTLDAGLRAGITIVVRMQEDNATVRDYYFLPGSSMDRCPSLKLAPDNGVLLDAYRFDSLQPFLDLTRRVPFKVAA
jgi:hypothetical protein